MDDLQDTLKRFTERFKTGHMPPIELRNWDRDPRLKTKGAGAFWMERHMEECAECQYWERERQLINGSFERQLDKSIEADRLNSRFGE